MVKIQKFPPAPYKRFGSFGFGIMISNDNQFSGISILLGFWQINMSPLSAAVLLLVAIIMFLFSLTQIVLRSI